MRRLLPLLIIVILLAAPLTATAATSRSYAIGMTLSHLRITQGSKITISGRVSTGHQVDVTAIAGTEPYANVFDVGVAKVSSGKYSKTYTPRIPGTYHFRLTALRSTGTVIAGTTTNSDTFVVVPSRPENRHNQLVVIGDSISDPALYNDIPRDRHRAWWSFLRSKTGLEPHIFAQRGSGYGKKGSCGAHPTSTYGERASYAPIAKRLTEAKVVVIEGGINDYLECVQRDDGTWHSQPADPRRRAAAVEQTMRDVDDAVATNSRVFVIVPWGPRAEFVTYRDEIANLIEARAKAHGFTYVDMAHGTLDADNTRDGVHPNATGAADMYRQLYYDTDLVTRFPR